MASRCLARDTKMQGHLRESEMVVLLGTGRFRFEIKANILVELRIDIFYVEWADVLQMFQKQNI